LLMNRRPDEWREQQEHTHRFVDDKRTAAELFAELQAEAAERGIRLIPSDDGTFEPVEAAKIHFSATASGRSLPPSSPLLRLSRTSSCLASRSVPDEIDIPKKNPGQTGTGAKFSR
jgi:hypothetical protein